MQLQCVLLNNPQIIKITCDAVFRVHHKKRFDTEAMKFSRVLVLLFMGWCSMVLAAPTDLITDRAWVEDPTGRMTLDQVQQSAMQPLASVGFNKGYSDSAFWFRFRIDPSHIAPDQTDERLVMRIWPPYQDDLQLFDPLDKRSQPQITGDLHPQLLNDYRSFNLNFTLPRGDAPREVWVRLKTTTSTLTDFEVVTETEAKSMDWRQAGLSMLYVAAIAICLGWAVLAWQLLHDRLILYFIARELATIVYAIAVLGGLRAMAWQWLPPFLLDGIVNFMACWIAAVAIWFDIQLLGQYRPNVKALWMLRACAALYALASFMTVLGYTTLGFKLNSGVAILTPLVLLFTALSTRAWTDGKEEKPPDFSRWALVGLYMVLPMVVLLNRAVLMGWVPPIVLASHVALTYLLIGSIVMMVLLQLRALRSYRHQQEVHLQLRVAEQLAHEERAGREEQERFLAMLGHELRNPLAAVDLLADPLTEEGQQIRRAVSDMKQVLERSVQSGQLDNARFVPVINFLDMHTLMREVCKRSDRLDLTNFEPATSLHSDRMWLLIALGNLVDNALKYSPPDSRVQVICLHLALDGRDTLQIQVRNALGAAGWPDAQQLFQKYHRGPKAHHQIGSGLGLYLTKSLLDMLKIRLEYVRPSDAQAQDVVFEVTLPDTFGGR